MKKVMRKAGAADAVSEVSEVDPGDVAALADQVDIDQKIREWVARENPENQIVHTYVYKYLNNTDTRVMCDRLDGDDFPDPHAVGLKYGGGRYMLIISIPKGESQDKKFKALRFNLHPRYDELCKVAAAAPVAAPAAVAAQSSLADGVAMVKTVLEVIKPLLESRAAAVAPASGPDVSKLLESNYDMMAGVLRKSLEQGQELITEVHRAKLESAGADVETEPDFLEKIMPLVEKFLPLLTGGGAGAATTAAAIRSLPEFGRLVNNTRELRRIVAYLEQTKGKEKTAAVLRALKISRPVVRPANRAGGNNGRDLRSKQQQARGPVRVAAAAAG